MGMQERAPGGSRVHGEGGRAGVDQANLQGKTVQVERPDYGEACQRVRG